MNFGKCEDLTKNRIIVLEENKRQLVIKNPKRDEIRQIRVDGCVITLGRRCDFLIIDSKNTEYFVELKGCDVEHAISQLETTIQQLGAKIRSVKRFSFIISSRCPLITPKIQKLKLHFRKNLMSELIIKNHILEISL